MNPSWRPIGAALIVFCSQLATAAPAVGAWDHAHGDGGNSGFAKVDTAPAATPQQVVKLGILAPGAGPVIGPSGMLYVGMIDGRLLAFQPNGTPAWNRILPARSLASPVVGADGSVYIASVRRAREPSGGGTRYDSTLHKFSGDGGVFWAVPLPAQPVNPPKVPALAGWPAAVAPPSMWRSGSTEVVVMPVLYSYPSSAELRVLAFSTQSGGVVGNALVASKTFEVTGTGPAAPDWTVDEWVCTLTFLVSRSFSPTCLTSLKYPNTCGELCLKDTSWPMPGVAIAPDSGGSAPLVIVSDELSRYTVGYRFDPATGFNEAWRVPDPARTRTSAPTVLPDLHRVVLGAREGDGSRGRLSFVGPGTPAHDRPVKSWVVSPPTRLLDGRIAVIEFEGELTVFQGGIVDRSTALVGQSIASAAASCTHLFVASAAAFTTYDANTLAQVAQVPWSGGGRSSPVIGPTGYVYGVTHGGDRFAADRTDSLYVWPPPQRTTAIGLAGTACDRVVVHPQR
jgi:hypothetical protein